MTMIQKKKKEKVQTLIVKHLKLVAEKMDFYFPKPDLQPIVSS